jgi:hypothetical protein
LKRKIKPVAGLNAHHLIAATAMEMANELFEVYAAENDVYRKMRADGAVTEKDARHFFVLRMTPKLYEDARQHLASCLAEPDDLVTAKMKEDIYEALCLDNDLRANRMVARDVATIPTVLH